jgi:hypothetical protein
VARRKPSTTARPDAVLVLEEELDRTVVDDHDRERDTPGELAEQPVAARGRLLRGCNDPSRRGTDRLGDEVGADVKQQVGRSCQDPSHMLVMVGHRVGVPRVDPDSRIAREVRRDAVVGRGRAARHDELRAAGPEHFDQDGRLRLHVKAHPYASAGERAVRGEALAKPS